MNQNTGDNKDKDVKHWDNRIDIVDRYDESEEKSDLIFMVEEIEAYLPGMH